MRMKGSMQHCMQDWLHTQMINLMEQVQGPWHICSRGCLIWPQWEKMCLILLRPAAPEKGDVWGGRSTLSEAKGRRNEMKNCGRETRSGATSTM